MFFVIVHLWLRRATKTYIVEKLQMANHAEVLWTKYSRRWSTQNRYAKTYPGYFDRASGFAGGFSMWSLGVGGNPDVIGMEKSFRGIGKQSMSSGVTWKDPFLRGILGLFSERLWVFVLLIPLSGVYGVCVGTILVVWVYFGHTSGACYIDHLMGVHYAYSGRMLVAHQRKQSVLYSVQAYTKSHASHIWPYIGLIIHLAYSRFIQPARRPWTSLYWVFSLALFLSRCIL